MQNYKVLLAADILYVIIFSISLNFLYNKYLQAPDYAKLDGKTWLLSFIVLGSIVVLFVFLRIFKSLKVLFFHGNGKMISPLYAGIITIISGGFLVPGISAILHWGLILLPFSFMFSRTYDGVINFRKMKIINRFLLISVFILIFTFVEWSSRDVSSEGQSYAGLVWVFSAVILTFFGVIMEGLFNRLEVKYKNQQL